MNELYLGVFGTFGNPHGSTQTFYNKEYKRVGLSVKTFDIMTSAIQLYPRTSMYLFRKEKVKNTPVISYAVYSYAQEKGSTRGGTYVGSSIVAVNCLLEERGVLSLLNKFHQSLINNHRNILNGNIEIKHSNEYTIDNFYNFKDLKTSHKKCSDINFNIRNKSLLVYCNSSKLQNFLSLSVELFNLYDAIYFTENKQIVEYVHKKGLLDIATEDNFNDLLNRATKERVKQCENIKEQATSWSKTVIDKVNENKKTIDNKKQIHKQNELSISKMEKENQKILSLVNENFNEINELVRQLQTTPVPSYSKIDEIKNKIEQKRQELNNELREINGLPKIEKIDKPKPINILNTTLTIETPIRSTSFPSFYPSKDDCYTGNKERKGKSIIKVIKQNLKLILILFSLLVSLLLGGLIIGDILYENEDNIISETYSPYNNEKAISNNNENTVSDDNIESLSIAIETYNKLNKNDYNVVVRNLMGGMSLQEVVNIIYKKNPTDISKPFKDKKTEYSKYLYQKNIDYFEIKGNDTILINKQLKEIPCK